MFFHFFICARRIILLRTGERGDVDGTIENPFHSSLVVRSFSFASKQVLCFLCFWLPSWFTWIWYYCVRTMASPKNTNNSDMGMYSISNSFKIRNNDDERRNARFHMLLATTYDLNNSYTKTIHVGLQRTNEKNLQTSCEIERT